VRCLRQQYPSTAVTPKSNKFTRKPNAAESSESKNLRLDTPYSAWEIEVFSLMPPLRSPRHLNRRTGIREPARAIAYDR
jgi:hypothetical protein